MHIYSFNDLKFTFKHLNLVLWQHAATAPTERNDVNHWVFLNYNFSKELCMLPEDDRIIETCRSI